MRFPRVTRLYSYRPANTWTLNIFREQKLYAAKPARFNDPFDCDLDIAGGITEEEFLAAAEAKYGPKSGWSLAQCNVFDNCFGADGKFTANRQALHDAEIEKFLKANKDSGVVCLAEANDLILMWSHYACNHTGICIEYERSPINTLGDWKLCQPVHYSLRYPAIRFGEMLLRADGTTLNRMMRYKAACWNYEKEWRLFTDKGNCFCPLPGQILRVIFGLRTSTWYRSRIQNCCTKLEIPTVQARKAPRKFKIIVPSR